MASKKTNSHFASYSVYSRQGRSQNKSVAEAKFMVKLFSLAFSCVLLSPLKKKAIKMKKKMTGVSASVIMGYGTAKRYQVTV